jgi:hypothetical protein
MQNKGGSLLPSCFTLLASCLRGRGQCSITDHNMTMIAASVEFVVVCVIAMPAGAPRLLIDAIT